MQFFPIHPESEFQPTYQLVAPAGEKIPVMLVSQAHSFRYLVISRIEWEGDSPAVYEWHPSEGVTCQGIQLEALSILPLADLVNSNHNNETLYPEKPSIPQPLSPSPLPPFERGGERGVRRGALWQRGKLLQKLQKLPSTYTWERGRG